MNLPNFTSWLDYEPYKINSAEKTLLLNQTLTELTRWHASNCTEYRAVIEALGFKFKPINQFVEIPFIPVRLFKEFDFLSIQQEDIFKTMTSSGTSGQNVSRIYLDKETASLQVKVLSRLMADVLGKKRIPMLVIDSPSVLKDRVSFSARGAGILGFSMFGQDVTYALDENMNLDEEAVQFFLARHPNTPIFVFGFTFMIWQYLLSPLIQSNKRLGLDRAIVLHGGGWKKLQDQAVDNQAFRSSIRQVLGAERVVNYYGMVEQTGSLYMECEQGHLHAPVYSEIIVRRAHDFSPAAFGEEGIIEALSILPRSYPGHALLTEDRGVILGRDDCPCGRMGTYFHVLGRLEQAEVRGCSDTHETNH
jgi:phenylacetate-coenzyme A ligase PaaK-like adenylate-forming protein